MWIILVGPAVEGDEGDDELEVRPEMSEVDGFLAMHSAALLPPPHAQCNTFPLGRLLLSFI